MGGGEQALRRTAADRSGREPSAKSLRFQERSSYYIAELHLLYKITAILQRRVNTKIMKKLLLATAFALTALVSATANATETPSFYGTANLTSAHLNGDTAGFDRFGKNAFGGSVALGAVLTPSFAVEVAYQEFGRFDYTLHGFSGKIRSRAVGLQLVAAYPVTEKLSLVVKPGMVHSQFETLGAHFDMTNFSFAAGAEYALNSSVALTGTVQRINNFADTGTNLTAVLAGVKVNF